MALHMICLYTRQDVFPSLFINMSRRRTEGGQKRGKGKKGDKKDMKEARMWRKDTKEGRIRRKDGKGGCEGRKEGRKDVK